MGRVVGFDGRRQPFLASFSACQPRYCSIPMRATMATGTMMFWRGAVSKRSSRAEATWTHDACCNLPVVERIVAD